MIIINEHYLKLKASYLFLEIANRVSAHQKNNPDQEIIRLGIGDVTEPLPQACLDAFHAAVDEMGHRDTFRGYGPEQGYDFLREAIAKNEFQSRGVAISSAFLTHRGTLFSSPSHGYGASCWLRLVCP